MNDDDFEVSYDGLNDRMEISCIKCSWTHTFEQPWAKLDDLIGVASVHDCS